MRASRSTLLNESPQLSSATALRIEKAFGVSMCALLRMHSGYDIALASSRESKIKVAPFKGEPFDPHLR